MVLKIPKSLPKLLMRFFHYMTQGLMSPDTSLYTLRNKEVCIKKLKKIEEKKGGKKGSIKYVKIIE